MNPGEGIAHRRVHRTGRYRTRLDVHPEGGKHDANDDPRWRPRPDPGRRLHGSAVTTRGDASTDQAESNRGAAHLASVSTDRSGEHAEAVRGAAVLLGTIYDNSYDAVERSRAQVTS